jgi:hypothetical protein
MIGGWHPSHWKAMNSVFIYDLSSCTWRRGADMPRVKTNLQQQKKRIAEQRNRKRILGQNENRSAITENTTQISLFEWIFKGNYMQRMLRK